MNKLPTSPDETPMYLYNPSKEDFIYPWEGVNYTLPARNLSSFPKWLAIHLGKHLAQKLSSEDSEKIHYEERMKKWNEQIFVKI